MIFDDYYQNNHHLSAEIANFTCFISTLNIYWKWILPLVSDVQSCWRCWAFRFWGQIKTLNRPCDTVCLISTSLLLLFTWSHPNTWINCSSPDCNLDPNILNTIYFIYSWPLFCLLVSLIIYPSLMSCISSISEYVLYGNILNAMVQFLELVLDLKNLISQFFASRWWTCLNNSRREWRIEMLK